MKHKVKKNRQAKAIKRQIIARLEDQIAGERPAAAHISHALLAVVRALEPMTEAEIIPSIPKPRRLASAG